MTYGTPTDLAAILAVVAARLSVATGSGGAGVPADQVVLTLSDEGWHKENASSSRLVLVTPLDFPVFAPAVTGGGRQTHRVDALLRVAYLDKFAADQEGRDAKRLTHATDSILKRWAKVLSALQMYDCPDPTDATRSLLVQPMRIQTASITPRQVKQEWASLVSTWELKFVWSLS